MKGIAKFAEYSISGSLLWFNILIFITLLSLPEPSTNGILHNIMDIWAEWVQQFASHIKESSDFDSFKSMFNTLATSLFVLLIFCTGLLLDLLSPLFCTQMEVYFFKNNLKTKDKEWFTKLAETHHPYLQNDFTDFITEPLFTIKSPKVWRIQKKRYNRINAFLLAYLYTNAKQIYLTELTEKIRLWHTSRSITTSLIFLCVLLNFLTLSSSDLVTNNFSMFLYTIVIPLILLTISLAITIGAYCRVNDSILALAYHITKNDELPS